MRKIRVAVDTIIRYKGGIVLIKRKFGEEKGKWALPGGHVDLDEPLESAAVREAKEETGLDIILIRQMHTYSDPKRDPRNHVITTVFVAEGKGELVAGDDAAEAKVFDLDKLPELAFDHRKILMDYHNGEFFI